MKRRTSIFIMFVFLFVTGILSQASTNNSKKTNIQWKPVKRAVSYSVEIKPEKKLDKPISINTKETEVFIDLKPGKYTYRVGSANKFNKINHWSKWIPLEVIRTEIPILLEDKKYIFFIPEKEQELVVKGKHFLEEIEVELESNSKKFIIKNMQRISENEIRLLVNLESITEPISLRLILKNPLGKVIKKDDFVILEKKPPPKLPEVAEIKNMEEPSIFPKEVEIPEAKESKSVVTKVDYLPPLWRSALVPGWGQLYKGEYTKGFIISGSFFLFLGSSLIFENTKDYSIARSDRLSNYLFILPGDKYLVPYAFYLRSQSIESRHNAEAELEKQNAVLGIATVIYIYNIVDILWNKTSAEQLVIPKEETTRFYLNTGNQGKGSFQFGISYHF